MCFDFLFLLWLFFLQLKHQSYAGEGSGDSDLDQDYVHIFWWSSYVCGCLSFTKNDHEKSKIRQNSIWAKITNPSWAPEASCEKSPKLYQLELHLGAWFHPRLCRQSDNDDVKDDDDGDDDDVHGGGGKLLLRGTQSQASLDCRNNKFWSQSITIK